jgi:hypothetical protein
MKYHKKYNHIEHNLTEINYINYILKKEKKELINVIKTTIIKKEKIYFLLVLSKKLDVLN